MVWAETDKGKRIPLDAEPVDDGNIVMTQLVPRGMMRVRHVRKGEDTGIAPRYTCHFATCPEAAEHRKPRTQWNGADAECRRVGVIVGRNMLQTHWAYELVGKRRLAVEVKQGDVTFFLDDENGDAWRYVTGREPNEAPFAFELPGDSRVIFERRAGDR